jgi:hypothetical protein
MQKKYIKYILFVLPLMIIMFGCDSGSSDEYRGPDGTGKGGSTARFTICGNYLYTVNNYDMRVFSLADPANPAPFTKVDVGFGIETIYPRGDSLLFLGSQNGMYIFNIGTNGFPLYQSYFQHIRSCDPVVADAKYAYVTLNTNHNRCGRFTNELQIVDITNLNSPWLRNTLQMWGPQGLGIDNKTLFVCDNGLKVFDVTDVMNIRLKQNFNIAANDVIPDNGNLIVIGNDGLYQYKYDNDTITFLSKILKD